MLPVPIDAASAVMNAWNGVRTPALPAPERTNTTRQASPNRRNWTTPVRTVRMSPVPSSTATTHGMKNQSAVD